MTEPPEPLDRQRIAVYEPEDGSWIIARSGPICETCASCGCGEQLDPITVPHMFVSIIKARQEGKMPKIGDLRRMMGVLNGPDPG